MYDTEGLATTGAGVVIGGVFLSTLHLALALAAIIVIGSLVANHIGRKNMAKTMD